MLSNVYCTNGQVAKLVGRALWAVVRTVTSWEKINDGQVAKLVDALGLGPSLVRGGGSSPLLPTNYRVGKPPDELLRTSEKPAPGICRSNVPMMMLMMPCDAIITNIPMIP